MRVEALDLSAALKSPAFGYFETLVERKMISVFTEDIKKGWSSIIECQPFHLA